jgi:hypothetical protein
MRYSCLKKALLLLFPLLGLGGILNSCTHLPTHNVELSGQVLAGEEMLALPDALVTIRASQIQTNTDEQGYFRLLVPEFDGEIEITAWAPGYYIAYEAIDASVKEITLSLRRHHTRDHADYTWIDPTAGSSDNACGNCHPTILPQWESNAHGQAVQNPRFFSFYNGTDIAGQALTAPGYLSDFPDTSGNCATCHAPGEGIDAPFSIDMNLVRGEVTAGIHCDFCHKIGGVYLDPATDEPYANVPGVLSMQPLRPPEGEQIFIGPYPDIHDPDTYNPIFSQSAFCAPCHQFTFWGTEVYNSYGEWLDSDYADEGVTCQDCHMPPSGDAFFALEDQGGLYHPPQEIPAHFQLGVKNIEFMSSALSLDIIQKVENNQLSLRVILTNTAAGHHFPTDHPGRHLILVVKVLNQEGTPIPLKDGPVIPDWAGDPAGNPGKVYAKVLMDARSGDYPVVGYWKPTLIQSDNRLAANQGQETRYIFQLNGEPVTIQIRVLFRRLYQPIAEVYGWDLGEILLAEESFIIQP